MLERHSWLASNGTVGTFHWYCLKPNSNQNVYFQQKVTRVLYGNGSLAVERKWGCDIICNCNHSHLLLCTTNPQCPEVDYNMWSVWDFGNDTLWLLIAVAEWHDWLLSCYWMWNDTRNVLNSDILEIHLVRWWKKMGIKCRLHVTTLQMFPPPFL